jgi:hypothetical protein
MSDSESMIEQVFNVKLYNEWKDKQAKPGMPGAHCFDLSVMGLNKGFKGVYFLEDDQEPTYFAYHPPDEKHIILDITVKEPSEFVNISIRFIKAGEEEKEGEKNKKTKYSEVLIGPPLRLLYGVDIQHGKWSGRPSLARYDKKAGEFDFQHREYLIHSFDMSPGCIDTGSDSEYIKSESKEEDEEKVDSDPLPTTPSAAGAYFVYWMYLREKTILKLAFDCSIKFINKKGETRVETPGVFPQWEMMYANALYNLVVLTNGISPIMKEFYRLFTKDKENKLLKKLFNNYVHIKKQYDDKVAEMKKDEQSLFDENIPMVQQSFYLYLTDIVEEPAKKAKQGQRQDQVPCNRHVSSNAHKQLNISSSDYKPILDDLIIELVMKDENIRVKTLKLFKQKKGKEKGAIAKVLTNVLPTLTYSKSEFERFPHWLMKIPFNKDRSKPQTDFDRLKTHSEFIKMLACVHRFITVEDIDGMLFKPPPKGNDGFVNRKVRGDRFESVTDENLENFVNAANSIIEAAQEVFMDEGNIAILREFQAQENLRQKKKMLENKAIKDLFTKYKNDILGLCTERITRWMCPLEIYEFGKVTITKEHNENENENENNNENEESQHLSKLHIKFKRDNNNNNGDDEDQKFVGKEFLGRGTCFIPSFRTELVPKNKNILGTKLLFVTGDIMRSIKRNSTNGNGSNNLHVYRPPTEGYEKRMMRYV